MIERRIYQLRGQRVMVDADLAELYQVETGALTRAVKRNLERFPADFMFQLTADEWEALRCQTGISNDKASDERMSQRPGRRRYLPYVFTEQGVAMLSSVLRSARAIQVNIGIMRAFSRLRKSACPPMPTLPSGWRRWIGSCRIINNRWASSLVRCKDRSIQCWR